MEVHFRKVSLQEIAHLIPPGGLYVLPDEITGDTGQEGWALLYEGDATLAGLQLDDAGDDDGEDVLLYLVTGNLTVDGDVYCNTTDGAISLVVLGDLRARNLIVGGQEIYVGGDLAVEELFWGDYNHGLLTVQGAASAEVCLQTDDYDIKVYGQSFWQHHVYEWEEAGLEEDADGRTVSAWFSPDCLYEHEGTMQLDRERLIERLRSGRPCFLLPEERGEPEFQDLEQLVFPDTVIQAEILDLATAPALMPARPEEDESRNLIFHHEWWGPGTEFFYRLAVEVDRDTKNMLYQAAYIQQAGQRAVIWERPSQSKTVQDGGMAIQWQSLRNNDDGPWQDYEAERDTGLAALLPVYGEALLRQLSLVWHTGQQVPAGHIEQLLALPLAEPYDDYEDEVRCGLWLGNWYFGFRQENALSEGQPADALLEIGREYADSSAEDGTNMERFFYTVQPRLDGNKYTVIQHQREEDADLEEISHTDAAMVRRAVRVLRVAGPELLRANERLLAGERVGDDRFALRYWKKKGYLR